MGFVRCGTAIGPPTEKRQRATFKKKEKERKLALAQSYRLQNNDKLTNCCDWNPVGHHRQAIANKQTWGETHDLFEKVLQPPTEAAL